MDRTAVDRALTWLLLPAALALVVSALTLPRHAYTGLSSPEGRILSVAPGSPGARAGLKLGDRLIAERTGRRPSPLDASPLTLARPGEPLVVLRERAGTIEPAWLVPEPLPESERRVRAFLFAISSVFLLLGGWVWSERRDRLARVFLLLCVAFSGMLIEAPSLSSRAWQFAYDIGYTAAQLFGPVLFAHFFALFPDPPERSRASALVHGGYVAATALFVAVLATGIESLWGQGRLDGALPALRAISGMFLAVGIGVGLALFALSFFRSRDADARRRLRVAFVGTLLGAAPVAAVVGWHAVMPLARIPGERLSAAGLLLMPASFAWAIAVHRVFDFRVALRGIVLALLAAGVAVLTFAAGEWLAATWWPALGRDVSGASLAFLALVSGLAGPSRPWIAALGARVIPIAGEIALGSWTPSEEATAAGDGAVLEEACRALASGLKLDGCAAVRAVDGRLVLAATAGLRAGRVPGIGFLHVMERESGPRPLSELALGAEDREVLESAGARWALAVPGTPCPAVLLLGTRMAGSWLDVHEARDLEQLTHHLAVALENADLRREVRHRAAYQRELREAHAVQLKRLPRRTPVYPTLDCAAATLSTESVGGDYYDFVEDGPRHFTMAVGDAAGHGVPAALVLAGVQARFRDMAQRARHPGDVLDALNHDLVALEQPEKFMGLLCARVDVSGGWLRFANAGLTPPLVRRRDGSVEEHTESGLLLGVSASASYSVSTVELGAGDITVVYTDGLSEASRGGRMFGTSGLRRILDEHAHRRAADIVEELIQAVRQWTDEPLDDLTVVVLKRLTGGRHAIRTHSALKPGGPASDTGQ